MMMPAGSIRRDGPHGLQHEKDDDGRAEVTAQEWRSATVARIIPSLRPPRVVGGALGCCTSPLHPSPSLTTRFAPLHIPPHRRLQTFAILTWTLLMPLCLMVFFFAL